MWMRLRAPEIDFGSRTEGVLRRCYKFAVLPQSDEQPERQRDLDNHKVFLFFLSVPVQDLDLATVRSPVYIR
jgi:hypothetical protein